MSEGGEERVNDPWASPGSRLTRELVGCSLVAMSRSLRALVALPLWLSACGASTEQASRDGGFRRFETESPARPAVASAVCTDGMALIPGGNFLMGAGTPMPAGGDTPASAVPLVVSAGTPAEVDTFCMDVTEVTVDAYAQCSVCTEPGTVRYLHGCNWAKPGRGNHPVNCVDWEQAASYCRAIGKALPTEAQWEFAARGGSKQLEFPWGPEEPGSRACWNGAGNDLGEGNRLGTCPVGSFAAGAYGLRDMAGNVSEWVQDRYADYYPERVAKGYSGPPVGSSRVFRGGSWGENHPSAFRGGHRAMSSTYSVFTGFRCVQALVPAR